MEGRHSKLDRHLEKTKIVKHMLFERDGLGKEIDVVLGWRCAVLQLEMPGV